MREHFKYDINELKPLLGKFISNLFFKEDFRFPNGSTGYFEPYYNRFSGIQNLVLWYYEEEEHYSIKFYCVRNGRFMYKQNGEEKNSHYGIRSIAIQKDRDLNFRKTGSIYLSPAGNFGVNVNRERITKISLLQEVHKSFKENHQGKELFPKLENPNKFPDRLVLEGDDLFIVIRAEEDYDQNIFLKMNIGYKFKDKSDYMYGLCEPDEIDVELIEQIQIE